MEKREENLNLTRVLANKFAVNLALGLVVSLVFVFLPSAVKAASLYFSPASGAYEVGKTFAVTVYLASANQAANAVSGVVSFPKNLMEVSSLSKAGSAINLWVQEPKTDNNKGSFQFEGIILNPGYKGGGAKIITVNFRIKAAGTGQLKYSSGAILANDGLGSDILEGLGGASYNFRVVAKVESRPSEQAAPVAKPKTAPTITAGITSPSHPNPSRWYADDSPVFNWNLPVGATGVSYKIDHAANSDAGTASRGIFSTVTLKNVADGSWYFHLRLQNKGGWGASSHYQFQIDTESPSSFIVKPVDGEVTDNSSPSFQLFATDTLSGVSLYKLKINDGEYVEVNAAGEPTIYAANLPQLGKYTLSALAIDGAGNSKTSTDLSFTVQEIMPPVFTDYSRVAYEGDSLVVRGKTYPNADVSLFLTREGGGQIEEVVRSNQQGAFVYVPSVKILASLYQLSAQVTNNKNTKSAFSSPITISVKKLPLIRIGAVDLTTGMMTTNLLFLLLLLILLACYALYKYLALKHKILQITVQANVASHQSFRMLHDNINRYSNHLAGTQAERKLTVDEDAMVKDLKNDFTIVEGIINGAVKHIGDEVK